MAFLEGRLNKMTKIKYKEIIKNKKLTDFKDTKEMVLAYHDQKHKPEKIKKLKNTAH